MGDGQAIPHRSHAAPPRRSAVLVPLRMRQAIGRLYLPTGQTVFRCRLCHDLTYQLEQEHNTRAAKDRALIESIKWMFLRERSPACAFPGFERSHLRHDAYGEVALWLCAFKTTMMKWTRQRKRREQRLCSFFSFVLAAAIHGLTAWVDGESVASYAKDTVWFVGFGFAYWFLAPFYYEFRIRAKEIDGKVSAIEKTVAAMREDYKELVEKLDGIEEELRSLRN